MRKAILLMILAVVSSNAAAEWVEVTSTDEKTFYAEPATSRKKGNMVKMWELVDVKPSGFTKSMQVFSESNDEFSMSTREKEEFDCKKEQTRTLYISTHSGNMGEGELISRSSNPGKWGPIVANSIDESLWKFACGKR
jgi:hypothetical protein